MTNQRDKNYKQVCVIHNMNLPSTRYETFNKTLASVFNLTKDIRIIGVIETLPGAGGPGGRSDLFFIVHEDDIEKLCNNQRISYGIRWWEDVLFNLSPQEQEIYPKAFRQQYPPIFLGSTLDN